MSCLSWAPKSSMELSRVACYISYAACQQPGNAAVCDAALKASLASQRAQAAELGSCR